MGASCLSAGSLGGGDPLAGYDGRGLGILENAVEPLSRGKLTFEGGARIDAFLLGIPL